MKGYTIATQCIRTKTNDKTALRTRSAVNSEGLNPGGKGTKVVLCYRVDGGGGRNEHLNFCRLITRTQIGKVAIKFKAGRVQWKSSSRFKDEFGRITGNGLNVFCK